MAETLAASRGPRCRRLMVPPARSVEAVDAIVYFSHMGFADRARLFWRRAGARGERRASIGKNVVKGMWSRRSRGND